MRGVGSCSEKSTPKPSEKFERLKGDGLEVKIPVIKDKRWVVGDGCRVVVDRNDGVLRVTGDGCLVQVNRNLGTVEYVGDGGRIVLGSESMDASKVSYKGDGGLVEVGGVKHYKSTGDKRSKSGKVVVTKTGEKDRVRVNVSVKGVVNWKYGKVTSKETPVNFESVSVKL